MKKLWLVSIVACGLICGAGAPLFAGSGGAAATKVQKRLMFKEKHKEFYHNGKQKVFGIIAQVCDVTPQYKNAYTCPPGARQSHVRHGVWKWWWSNGKMMAQRTYKMGHLVGESRAWFESGKLRWVERFNSAGKREGKRVVFYATGAKKRSESYSNGALNGVKTLWWSNGAKSAQGTYAHGQREGSWRTWYVNGDIKELISFKDDKRHGAYVLFRSICQPSGCASVKTIEGSFNNGSKHGKWSRWYFDAEGKKKSKLEIWKNGRRTL